jgi:hypothetical protein
MAAVFSGMALQKDLDCGMVFQTLKDCQSGLFVSDLDDGLETVVFTPPARPTRCDLHRVRGAGLDDGLVQEIGLLADDLVAPEAGVDDVRSAVLMIHERMSRLETVVVGIGIK